MSEQAVIRAANAVAANLEAEIERLKAVIERDRCKVADAVVALKKALRQREWLRLGRGSYEWDDDRWRDEFAAAWQEFWDATERLSAIAADTTDSLETTEKIFAAREQLSQQHTSGERNAG
jgi:hypothetical protein